MLAQIMREVAADQFLKGNLHFDDSLESFDLYIDKECVSLRDDAMPGFYQGCNPRPQSP